MLINLTKSVLLKEICKISVVGNDAENAEFTLTTSIGLFGVR